MMLCHSQKMCPSPLLRPCNHLHLLTDNVQVQSSDCNHADPLHSERHSQHLAVLITCTVALTLSELGRRPRMRWRFWRSWTTPTLSSTMSASLSRAPRSRLSWSCARCTQCPCIAGSTLLHLCTARNSCQHLLQQKDDTERQQERPHAHVAWVEERSLEAQVLMVASALAQDGDLDKFIKAQARQLLPEDTILLNFVQICLAVHYIHNKVSLPSGSACH